MTSITARGTRYDVSGPTDANPVVLVHGLGLTRDMWQWQLDDLQPPYRVITYDLVGHGET
ncbi:MAG: alpha/beta fold hydrolase, partial [Hyphomicrobiaceae bacterium]